MGGGSRVDAFTKVFSMDDSIHTAYFVVFLATSHVIFFNTKHTVTSPPMAGNALLEWLKGSSKVW